MSPLSKEEQDSFWEYSEAIERGEVCIVGEPQYRDGSEMTEEELISIFTQEH